MGDLVVFNMVMKTFIVLTTPVTFLVGFFLLYDIDMYLRIEKILARSYFGVTFKWADVLERNRDSLHAFLLKRRKLVGWLCVINAIAVFFLNLMLVQRI